MIQKITFSFLLLMAWGNCLNPFINAIYLGAIVHSIMNIFVILILNVINKNCSFVCGLAGVVIIKVLNYLYLIIIIIPLFIFIFTLLKSILEDKI